MLNARRIPLARGKLQMDYSLLSQCRVRDVRGSVLIYTNCDFYLCGGVCVGVVEYDVIFFLCLVTHCQK